MEKALISFTHEQLVILNNALVEMPFKVAQPLIIHINAEIEAQRALADAQQQSASVSAVAQHEH